MDVNLKEWVAGLTGFGSQKMEEIGFIMLVVAASLCCATFNMVFLGIILIVAVAALLILRLGTALFKGSLNDGMLIITLPTEDYQNKRAQLLDFLESKLRKGRLDGITEKHDESVISYGFVRLEKNTLLELQGGLKKIAMTAKSSVFFNRSGEV